ncbi:MAG: CRISPR-associated RAMP protein Csx10 [Chloroflexi bacterium]|nr:CRISPR-associated RAMP protein Csx10 [Chloroflexota bacterium]
MVVQKSRPVQLSLTLTVETALSIGAGGSSGGFADKTIVRKADNLLLVPGSHLKGRLRHACEVIARAAGYEVCSGPRAEKLCPQRESKPNPAGRVSLNKLTGQEHDSNDQYCIVCQLFGAPAYPSPLQFHDLVLEEAEIDSTATSEEAKKEEKQARLGLHGLAVVRPGVSVNRMRGVAEDNRLYFTETTRPGIGVRFSNVKAISGSLPLIEGGPTEDEYLKLLIGALCFNRQWGGGKTRGLGWAELHFEFNSNPDWLPAKLGFSEDHAAPKSSQSDPTPSFKRAENATELILTLEALSPLSLSDRKPDSEFRRSQSFIPGRVLRGALAGYLRSSGKAALFEQLFSTPEGQLLNHFGHAMPTDEKFRAGYNAPTTARTCKHDTKHGVFDTLIDLLVYEERLRSKGRNGPIYAPECPNCRGRLEALVRLLIEQGDGKYESISPPEGRMLTRVAINRRRAVAEDSLLYSPLVINEGAKFQARIKLQDSASASDLFDFLEHTPEFHIGGGRSRGLGLVRVVSLEARAYDVEKSAREIQKRVEAFNKKLNEKLQVEDKEKLYLTLGARSELALAGEVWQLETELKDLEASVVRNFVGITQRSGWNQAWGLMLDTQLLVTAGSVYVLSVSHRVSGQKDFYQKLADLEHNGLGEGQSIGYGTIAICEPFHYTYTQK